MPYYKIINDKIYLYIKVKTKAKDSKILVITDFYIKIQVRSEPIDNEANEELLAFLSKWLFIPNKEIKIIRGKKSSNKIVQIPNIDTINKTLIKLTQ